MCAREVRKKLQTITSSESYILLAVVNFARGLARRLHRARNFTLRVKFSSGDIRGCV